MNRLLINDKKYRLFDFIGIPFKVCPRYLCIMVANCIVNALVPSFIVLTTADFVDKALLIFKGEAEFYKIYVPLILYMLIILYSKVNRAFITNFIEMNYKMDMDRYYKSEMIKKRANLQYRYIENNESWDLIARVCKEPIEKITGGTSNLLDILDIVIRIGSLILILMANVWWAGLIILIAVIPLMCLAAKGGHKIYDSIRNSERYMRRSDYYKKVLTNRENVEERIMFGYSSELNKKFYKLYETARKISLKVDLEFFIKMKISSIITVIISISIIGFLLYPLSRNDITIGMFMGLTTATLDLVQMMSWHLANVVEKLAQNREYLNDLTKFMSLSEKEGALNVPEISKDMKFESIEFKDVYFKYPDTDKYILKNFNLNIEKNHHYAFVGINGAGKTTITKLLTGMYDNYTGTILINNKELKEYKLQELKSMFSVVYQDFAKYYITMKSNIMLGDVNMMDKENARNVNDDSKSINEHKSVNIDKNSKTAEKIACSLGLGDVIELMPDGLDTFLGKINEGGRDLSGGQWQKVAIARTLFNKAYVRILDEPTAALDPIAESNIYDMFGNISRDMTTIFITHRLGAARLADEIIVIDEGCVKEKGSHDELMKLSGIYKDMFDSQRSWYVDDKKQEMGNLKERERFLK